MLSGLSGRQTCSNRSGESDRRETVVQLASITDQTVNRKTAIGSGLVALRRGV